MLIYYLLFHTVNKKLIEGKNKKKTEKIFIGKKTEEIQCDFFLVSYHFVHGKIIVCNKLSILFFNIKREREKSIHTINFIHVIFREIRKLCIRSKHDMEI